MKISKSIYGYIIVVMFLGGLILTKLLGVWVVHERDSGGGGHRSSEQAIHRNSGSDPLIIRQS